MDIKCNAINVRENDCLLNQYLDRHSFVYNISKSGPYAAYTINLDKKSPLDKQILEARIIRLCAECKYAYTTGVTR